eukprot:1162147-Pelagomonas_calceolata.AAC.15
MSKHQHNIYDCQARGQRPVAHLNEARSCLNVLPIHCPACSRMLNYLQNDLDPHIQEHTLTWMSCRPDILCALGCPPDKGHGQAENQNRKM